MKHKIVLFFSLVLLISISCKTTSTVAKQSVTQKSNSISLRAYSVQALLWQQQAAEYKALTYQAFNMAKMYLDKALENHYEKPLAIVTDIDETVLDNSPYNARMVSLDQDYTKQTWVDWGKEAKAKAISGALSFFQYAKAKGVSVYYISNRYFEQKEETMKNLKNAGFPDVDKAHVLLRKETSSKKSRRESIQKTHEIIILLGDNLSDFSELFDKQSTKNRNNLVSKMKNEFGTKYIVLPNPMYGDWESKGIYEGNYKWNAAQKDSIRKVKLRLN